MDLSNLPILAVACLIIATVTLLWLTYMDAKHYLLPDKGNIVLGLSALIFHAITNFIYISPLYMIVGALAGSLIFIFARWYGLKVKKIDGVGLGDIKFAASSGLWLGPFGVSVMILLSAISLLIIGGTIILIKKKDFRSFYLPFGAVACPVTIALIIVDILFIRLSIVFS